MKETRSNNTPFWLLLIGIVLMLVGRNLFVEGMFLDGVTYASISRNMAEGLGTFWNPYYTLTMDEVFHSHPPLAFGLEALAFMALGDHFYVERVYSLVTLIVSAALIVAIWKRTTNRPQQAWLPLLFWVAMPLVSWCASNNMLENTMTVFVLLSVWLMLLSYLKNSKIWLFLAGIALLLAFMSKGVTGLFPLVFPVVYCAFDEKRHWLQGPMDALFIVIELAVLTGLMFLVFPPSLLYLKDYFQVQVMGTGLNVATVATRFSIVFAWLGQMAIPLVVAAILFIVNKFILKSPVKTFEFSPDRKWFWLFTVFGLTGVLPIMVSRKQSDFYMLSALPFFALACGHLTLAMVNMMQQQMKKGLRLGLTIGACCVVLTGLVISVTRFGKYDRDEQFLIAMKKALLEIPENEIVGVSTEGFPNWSWHAYFMRYGKVSLDDKQPHEYNFSYHP